MKPLRNPGALDDFKPWKASATDFALAEQNEIHPFDLLSRGERTASWICAVIAAAIMIETLFFKFTGAAESVYIFSKMGTEPWMRWVQGFWELIASVGLLWPRLRWAGGILTVGAMGAAILSHFTWLGLAVRGDGGLLFGMAVTTFLCGFIAMFLHRQSIPNYERLRVW